MSNDGSEDGAEEVDPDLAAMWQRFQHLTDKLSASNERSDAIKTEIQSKKQREPHTPARFPSLELNEHVTDSTTGAEHVDAVLASASDLESSNAVLPALLSLDALFEECLRPHPPLIAALARPDAITKMIQFAAFERVDIGDHAPDRLAFASCKLLSCGWWGRTHGILDMIVSAEPLEVLIDFPSRCEPPMNPRASFFWARIMRTVLNEKHGEVLEHLRQDSRALVSMLSALAAHAASETEAGPLLWEMLTDEELAELAASVGAGPYLAGSLVSSLELASRRGDSEAISVGTRLTISMLELMPGHRILPHFRDAMVQVVPGVLAALDISDPVSLSLSIADVLLAVLSPNSHDGGTVSSGSPRDSQPGQSNSVTVGAKFSDNDLAEARALSSKASTIQACKDTALGLLHKFAGIGEVDGTSLVRRRRRETSFQFTVMRPRVRRGGNASATRPIGETASAADVQRAAMDQAGNPQRPAVAMASTARERRIAFAEEKERAAAAATALHASTTPRLRVGTAELAVVRAVGRLLQGGVEDGGYGDCSGYIGWIGQHFVAHGLGDVCIALLCEFEDREHDLLHCALIEVLEGALLCGVQEVAQTVLLRGTMGGLCRFAISSFRRVPQRGSSAAFLVDLINIIESTPQLSEMIRREMHASWNDFVCTEIAAHNAQRRHVFDQQSYTEGDEGIGQTNGNPEGEGKNEEE